MATVIRSELTHRVRHDLSELLNLARVSRLIPHSQPDSNDLSSHSGRDTETWSWDLVHGTLFTLGKALRLGQENLHGFRKVEGETYIQRDERGTSSEYRGHQVKQDTSRKGAWLLAPQETSV